MKNKFTLLLNMMLATLVLSVLPNQTLKAQTTYCTPEYGGVNCIAGMDISEVNLAGSTITLNNTTSCSTNGYGDYTNLTAPDLIQGETYDLSVSTSYVITASTDVRIWIDYNNDGVFSNSEEIGNTNGNGMDASGTETFSFTVPSSVPLGQYRMRIRLVYAATSAIDPCNMTNFGETEDYMVQVITSGSTCSGQPSAGLIAGSDTLKVCDNADMNLEVIGATNESDMSFQWQNRIPAGTGTWANITNQNSLTLSIPSNNLPASSDYRFIATCGNSNLSDTTNVITALLSTIATDCYCIPEGTNSNRYINDFTTSGAIQDVSNVGSGFSVNGYGDFTSDTIEQYLAEDINISLAFENEDFGVKIWVDWNQDGIFDPNEVAFVSTSFESSLIGTISIPDTALLGTTRLRIGISSMLLSGPPTPCETGYALGEFEDYTLSIVEPGLCSGTPSAGVLPSFKEVCASLPFNLEAIGATSSYGISNLEGQWQSREPINTGPWVDIPGANSPTSSVTIYTPTDFRFIYTCGSNSDTSNIMTTTFMPANDCYCTPEGTDPNRYINNFSTNSGMVNINNTNTGFSPNGYGQYLTDTIMQKRGHLVQFSADLQGGTAGLKIWVDWNNDGHFDGNDELAYASSFHATTHDGQFFVPHESMEGATRMRVGSSWSSSNGPPSPCETDYNQGEYEDYIFFIQPCDTPLVNLGPDTAFCEGESIVLHTGNNNSGLTVKWNDIISSDTLVVDTSGTYTVRVSDIYNCANHDTINIEVIALPYAENIEAIWFNDGVYNFKAIDAANIDSYLWDFGDGNTSTDAQPQHTYAEEGSYEITLTITNDCGEEILTTNLDYVVGIDQITLDKNQLKIYPNPSRDYLTIKNNSQHKMNQIIVYNMLGQEMVNEFVPDDSTHELNLEAYSSGIYKVKINFEDGSWSIRTFEVIK